jgi:RNA polymerase sigma-70 factor (ECF subfamily)
MARLDAHPPEETPDAELVRRISLGDETALSALYRRYVDAIYRFVLAQVRCPQDAEDLTSETFARMLRGLSGFRGEAAFRNWLYQIARNGVRNHRRSAAYRTNVPLSRALAADASPMPAHGDDDDPARSAKRQQVVTLLRPLPPRYRQVLELRFLEGNTIEETAARMGVTIGNAKVIQHRALKKAAAIADAEGRAAGGHGRVARPAIDGPRVVDRHDRRGGEGP